MRQLLILLLLTISSAPALAQVEIRLRSPSISCSRKTVRIQDIADLTGGNPRVRQQLAGLDVDEFTAERSVVQVNRQLVRYRAVLAGINEIDFTITGGSGIVVTFAEPINATRLIEQALTDQLALTFQIPDSAFEVQLTTPIDSVLNRSTLDLSTVTVAAQFPVELPLGQRSLELTLTDGAGRTQSVTVSTKIAVYRDLVMAKQNISRGEVLVADKLERVRRPIDNSQVNFASYEQTIGKQAQSDIQQFTLLKAQFVRDVAVTAEPLDVKKNDALSVIIRRGPLIVTLKDARARENGRIGDTIDLLNPQSREIIRAKIVDGSTAVIEY